MPTTCTTPVMNTVQSRCVLVRACCSVLMVAQEGEGMINVQRHQIEELVLLAGKTSTVLVKYEPTGNGLVLDRRTFRLTFRCRTALLGLIG